MNIQIISIGKVREKYIKSGIEEFTKRLKPFSSIKFTEIEPEAIKDENNIVKILDVESEKILNKIKPNSYTIVLEINSKQFTSENFAKKIKELSYSGVNQINFIIGGAYGLSDKVKKRADMLLSLSSMTFPHQLVKLFLVEQIYRAYKIINNEPYHK